MGELKISNTEAVSVPTDKQNQILKKNSLIVGGWRKNEFAQIE